MTAKPRTRPKLADVARLAGTSAAAVSVVLNGRVGESARVSEETQARIWDAVRTLGYTANPVARNLAGKRNRIIGIFTFEPTFPIESRDFYFPFLVGVEAEAARQDHDLLLFASAGQSGKRTIYHDGMNRLQLADGAVLLGRIPNQNELQRLVADRYPFVSVGRRDSAGLPIAYAAADYATATAQIVDHLFNHGHRNIAYFRSATIVESSTDRERGYREAFGAFGFPVDPRWIRHEPDEQITLELVDWLLGLGVSAFIAENDVLGEAVLTACTALGRECPGDVSMAVLGDSMTANPAPRDWTSFTIPREAMGREAVRLLLRMLGTGMEPTDESDRFQVTLPCTFVLGSTVAKKKD